jgi:hypothetical protein
LISDGGFIMDIPIHYKGVTFALIHKSILNNSGFSTLIKGSSLRLASKLSPGDGRACSGISSSKKTVKELATNFSKIAGVSTKELYSMAGIVFIADFFGWTNLQAVENFQFRILGDSA